MSPQLAPCDDTTTGTTTHDRLVEGLRNGFFAHNGTFSQSQYLDIIDEKTRSFLKEQWAFATGVILNVADKDDDDDGKAKEKRLENRTFMLNRWWSDLLVLHTEPHRAYHTVVHLHEMCHYLQLCSTNADQSLILVSDDGTSLDDQMLIKTIVILAIFFHDAVYDATSSTNEVDSANLFTDFVMDFAGRYKDSVSELLLVIEPYVAQCILATKSHQLPPSLLASGDDASIDALSLFLDLDLAVLGKHPKAYVQYARLIRREYAFVPHDVFCTKRADFLEVLLHQSNLYHTTICAQAWDARARDNIEQEILSLRRNRIVGLDHEGDEFDF